MPTRGDRFISSLADGRNVWLDGAKVKDLSEHAAFQGTLGTIKRLFNQLDDPALRDNVGFAPPGREAYAHSSFLVPYTAEDLSRRSRAFSYWADETHGMMSRLSDYGRSMITGWYAARKQLSQLDPDFEAKITAYYTDAR
ncbi:4-hydroxyphenylacetate 3-hydroxylase, partial [Paenibacillus sepulcri]|nr:4-hydroxyphenylacetate 3-hydroxylase [Paenibacillus sepulcri]